MKLQFQVEEPGTLTLRVPVATPAIDDDIRYEYNTEFFPNAVPCGKNPDGSLFNPYSWIVTSDEGVYLLHIYMDGTVTRLEIPTKELPYFEGVRDTYRARMSKK